MYKENQLQQKLLAANDIMMNLVERTQEQDRLIEDEFDEEVEKGPSWGYFLEEEEDGYS